MSNLVLCKFNSVNGQNTGCNARTGKGVNYQSKGVLMKKNCPNGFYVDTSDMSGSWFLLHNPSEYKLPNQTLYVSLKQSYILSPDLSTLKPPAAPAPTPAPPTPSTPEPVPAMPSAPVSTFRYTQGLDDKIYAMLNKEFSLAELNSNAKIMGTPFRFLKSADYRPMSNSTLGRKYIENILSEAPIVHIVPGVPNYMPDIDTETKGSIDAFIKARYNNDQISSDALSKILNADGRYYDFRSAYVEYIKYVNLLCRICAVYMGISDKNVPGTSTTYAKYDWGRWTNVNYTSSTKEESGAKNIWSRAISSAAETISDELFGDYKYVKCYVEPNVSFSESASNNSTSSQVAGLFDTMESVVREVNFFSTGSAMSNVLNTSTGAMTDVSEAIRKALDSDSSAGFSKIIGSAEKVLTGSNIIFPELWSDSSMSKSYSFTINLVSPYGDVESIFLNCIMPMMHFIALAMPRQTSSNSFGSPFLVKLFSKGWVSCDLGIIDSISIDKGGNSGTAWSVNGLPLEVKISLSIRDLYSNLMITKSTEPALFFNNQGLIDFLAVTCGVNIAKPNLAMKIESIISTFTNSLYDVPSNIYDNIVQGLRNSVEKFFKISNF